MEAGVASLGKRSLNDSSVATYAVCSNCSCLSEDLNVCESCGSSLSQEANASVHMSSSDPKRPRISGSASSSSIPITNTAASTASSSSNSSSFPPSGPRASNGGTAANGSLSDVVSPPVPVPQALFMNKNVAAAAAARLSPPAPALPPAELAAVPQTLYRNINNHPIGAARQPQLQPPPLSASPSAAGVGLLPTSSSVGQSPLSLSSIMSGITRPVENFLQNGPQNRAGGGVGGGGTGSTLNLPSMPINASQQLSSVQQLLAMSSANHVVASSSASAMASSSQARNASSSSSSVSSLLQQHRQHQQVVGAQVNETVASLDSLATYDLSMGPPFEVDEGGVVHVTGLQIRIGTKKFKPILRISFKMDGILFTLKDHQNAPVLLNSRAVVKTKFCLDPQYPIIFLYLEQSCMKQIRKIFGLTADDFFDDSQSHSKYKIRQCISLYLHFPPSSSTAFQTSLRAILKTMFAKLAAPANFEEISADAALDDMLDNVRDAVPPQTAAAVATTANVSDAESRQPHAALPRCAAPPPGHLPSTPSSSGFLPSTPSSIPLLTMMSPTTVDMHNVPQIGQMPGVNLGNLFGGTSFMSGTASFLPNGAVLTNGFVRPPMPLPNSTAFQALNSGLAGLPSGLLPNQQFSVMPSSMPPPQLTTMSMPMPYVARPPALPAAPGGYRQRQTPPATLAPVTIPSSLLASAAPTPVVIPNDQRQWMLLQKNLVNGGVYHVQMQDGAKKYCLWNGTNLVPCVIQNSEVLLEARGLRIGSFVTVATSPIKIVIDSKFSISFKFKSVTGYGIESISLNQDDVTKCQICLDACVMFLTLTTKAVDALRTSLKLLPNGNPTYTSHYRAPEYQKHFMIWLKSIDDTQKETLLQTRQPQGAAGKHLVEEMYSARCRQTFNNILNVVSQAEVARYTSMPLENISNKIFSANQSSTSMNGVAAAADDDDDVIMTQEELGIKCPYTQQVMKEPLRNKICGHNYEKAAIQEFILRRKGNAKCPYAGCGNTVPLSPANLEDNRALKQYIQRELAKEKS